MAYLALVRHGESEWNKKGLWTGWIDIGLTEKGREQARFAAENLKDIRFDIAYTSVLSRAKQTLDEIIKTLGYDFPSIENEALNERNYGDYAGKNKWEVKEQVGEKEFLKIRRGWDHPIPNGESLEDVYNRVVPYYQQNVSQKLNDGKNVLISAHGNSLRALVKYLENIPDEEISKVELAIGEVYLYQVDDGGNIVSKEKRASNNEIP